MKRFDWAMALVMAYSLILPVTVTLLVNRRAWGSFLQWFVGEGGSGWAQAIGSVLGIIVAALFVVRQIEANRELEIERRKAEIIEHQARELRGLLFLMMKINAIATVIMNNAIKEDKFSDTIMKVFERRFLNASEKFMHMNVGLLNPGVIRSANVVEVDCILLFDYLEEYQNDNLLAHDLAVQCNLMFPKLEKFATELKGALVSIGVSPDADG